MVLQFGNNFNYAIFGPAGWVLFKPRRGGVTIFGYKKEGTYSHHFPAHSQFAQAILDLWDLVPLHPLHGKSIEQGKEILREGGGYILWKKRYEEGKPWLK
jgi:hypothetical protein